MGQHPIEGSPPVETVHSQDGAAPQDNVVLSPQIRGVPCHHDVERYGDVGLDILRCHERTAKVELLLYGRHDVYLAPGRPLLQTPRRLEQDGAPPAVVHRGSDDPVTPACAIRFVSDRTPDLHPQRPHRLGAVAS